MNRLVTPLHLFGDDEFEMRIGFGCHMVLDISGAPAVVFGSPEQALALAKDLMVFAAKMIAFKDSKEAENAE